MLTVFLFGKFVFRIQFLYLEISKPTSERINLFAGTSTGSIIALGLASGVPIDTIVELYSSQKVCSKIFSPICLWPSRAGSVRHLRLANRPSSLLQKRPRTSGTGCASWGPSYCFRNIAATDCRNCWPPMFLTLRSPMSGRNGTKALLLRASN